ncbi:MAG: putative redox-active protein [Promethearchaeota archaeon]|nr:MAG: putative redox-active protein [Candidatus Lokiarchaeota archaeon]
MKNNLREQFQKKVEELREELPNLKGGGINCAELTLTNILQVLGIDNPYFHNLAIPLAGGFGGYKSKEGWQGACGAVCGGCAAIGIIMGGKERMGDSEIPMTYLKAAKFATDFEKEFGSVVCAEVCGYDFSTPEGMQNYQKDNVWKKTCFKFVIWAVENVPKMTKRDLRKKW